MIDNQLVSKTNLSDFLLLPKQFRYLVPRVDSILEGYPA